MASWRCSSRTKTMPRTGSFHAELQTVLKELLTFHSLVLQKKFYFVRNFGLFCREGSRCHTDSKAFSTSKVTRTVIFLICLYLKMSSTTLASWSSTFWRCLNPYCSKITLLSVSLPNLPRMILSSIFPIVGSKLISRYDPRFVEILLGFLIRITRAVFHAFEK